MVGIWRWRKVEDPGSHHVVVWVREIVDAEPLWHSSLNDLKLKALTAGMN